MAVTNANPESLPTGIKRERERERSGDSAESYGDKE